MENDYIMYYDHVVDHHDLNILFIYIYVHSLS